MELINENLKNSECKIWHRHPVWFLDGNPIVGYNKLKDRNDFSYEYFNQPKIEYFNQLFRISKKNYLKVKNKKNIKIFYKKKYLAHIKINKFLIIMCHLLIFSVQILN